MPIVLGVAALLLVLLAVPEAAFAWGPATHLRLGFDVVGQVASLARPVRDLIGRYPFDYLYGCIAADITTAKRLAAAHWHCHSWRVGYQVLRAARTDPQRSFANGYLCHLAADIASHNYYVPRKILASYPAVTLNHVYWEMRFDAFVEKEYWNVAHRVVERAAAGNDELIEGVVRRPIFSFRTNKRIFTSMVRNYRGQRWRRVLNHVGERSQWSLNRDEFEAYYALALSRTMDFLKHGLEAACVKEDPTGNEILRTAMRLSRRLRALERKGVTVSQLVSDVLLLPEAEPRPRRIRLRRRRQIR